MVPELNYERYKKAQSERDVRISLPWKECKRDSWGQTSERYRERFEASKL